MACEDEIRIASEHRPSTAADLHQKRGHALHQYIHLERQLVSIFEFAVGARDNRSSHAKRTIIAQAAFSQLINNSHNFRRILKKVADLYLQEQNEVFVRFLLKALAAATETRARIAHDETAVIAGDDGHHRHFVRTKSGSVDGTALFVEELDVYVKELQYLYYAVSVFRSAVFG